MKRGTKYNKISIKEEINRINQQDKTIPLINLSSSKELTPHTSLPNSHDNRALNDHQMNYSASFL